MRNTYGSLAAAALTLTMALLASGCASGDTAGGSSDGDGSGSAPAATQSSGGADDKAGESDPADEAGQEASSTDTNEDLVDPQIRRAFEVALQAAPGTVIGFEDDTHHGEAVWEVLVRGADGSGTEVKISQASGEIVSQESERLSAEESLPNKVSIEAAIGIALTEVPGDLMEIELDDHDGSLVWEADIKAPDGKWEVKIDANSAQVVKVERDD